jgi:hypothetical protein
MIAMAVNVFTKPVGADDLLAAIRAGLRVETTCLKMFRGFHHA